MKHQRELYRQKLTRLQDELNREELRAEAGEVLRSLISEVRQVSENGGLEVELAGDLVGILALTADSKGPIAMWDGPVQITMVAGPATNFAEHIPTTAYTTRPTALGPEFELIQRKVGGSVPPTTVIAKQASHSPFGSVSTLPGQLDVALTAECRDVEKWVT
jgi:hypothetical protein